MNITPNQLPTSNFEVFRQQLLNPNKEFTPSVQENNIMKVQKNLVLSYVADATGCGHLRCIFPMTYLNSIFGKTGRFNILISPAMIFQHDILLRCRSIFFQRTMAPGHIAAVQSYKDQQQKYGYRMLYDIDDAIYKGDDVGECIPEYNFGGDSIGDDIRKASIEIMNKMDLVCASTQFLGDYIKHKGVTSPIKVVPNAVAQYFWGSRKKKPIKEKIVKPRIISTASPTHWNQQKKMKGDFDNAFCDWIIKNVVDNKIEYCQMGGLPFFFEGLVGKPNFKYIDWINSFQYALPILEYSPHFSIGTLVPNFFNYSKSDLKYKEACAYGAVFLGMTFESVTPPKFYSAMGKNYTPSPYDGCQVKIPHNISVEEFDKRFWELTEPDVYNDILQKQYQQMKDESFYLESPGYVQMLTEIL